MTEMTPDVALALRRPFPPESVGKLPKGGVLLDYVGHAAVTDRLLTVDPNWSWEPFALGPDGLPAPDREGNLWIRLTICGVTRIGVGDGKSAKERIGDAIRNGAMRFGVALDLWAKENLVEFAQAVKSGRSNLDAALAANAPPPPPDEIARDPETDPAITEKQIVALNVAAKELGLDRDAKLAGIAATIGRPVESSKDLTRVEAGHCIDSLHAALAARKDAEANA